MNTDKSARHVGLLSAISCRIHPAAQHLGHTPSLHRATASISMPGFTEDKKAADDKV